MKNILKGLLLLLVTTGVFAVASVSGQGKQDFTLTNATGVAIYAVYITPHKANTWGKDVMGIDVLLNGESVDIKFSRSERAKMWDLRIEDETGAYLEWENLNLLEILGVTLYYENGVTTAVIDDGTPDLNGNWVGYYADGTRSSFVWAIYQEGSTLKIVDTNPRSKTKSRGTIRGNRVYAQDFSTKNGILSDDGSEIEWSDGVVWVRQ